MVAPPPTGAPRAMIIAGLGCAFWQQATGVEAAVYYTPETLEAAGITDETYIHACIHTYMHTPETLEAAGITDESH